ncbi:MAG: PKD domain-containing protein, partial [Methanomicrobiales archaeon]|nr:PKD domain-containing protein [Methanomicrobiales archaeon]
MDTLGWPYISYSALAWKNGSGWNYDTFPEFGDGGPLALDSSGWPYSIEDSSSYYNAYNYKDEKGWHTEEGLGIYESVYSPSLQLNSTGWPRTSYYDSSYNLKYAWKDPNPDPVANFQPNQASGPVPLNVQFYDWSTNNPIEWQWNFGDGTANESTQHPAHTFTQNGTYNVTLTVTNAKGKANLFGVGTLNATGNITVGSVAPTLWINWLTPTSGINGTSVSVTINGTNFAGTAATKVNLTRGGTTIVGKSVVVTGTTKITCTFSLPPGAIPGLWDLTVTNTTSGATGTKTNAFTIYSGQPPTVSAVSPVSGNKNTTIAFSVTGTNLKVGSVVNFTNSTFPGGSQVTVLDPVTSATKITGNVTFLATAPSGKWNVVVTVPDGRNATKTGAFTLNGWVTPSVTTVSPVSGYGNTTVPFTLTGTNYQAGAVVNFTNGTYGTVTTTISSITSTKITGNATFPAVASSGKWNINVTTPDGGTGTKAGAFTVNKWLQPSTTSVSPVSGYGNTTIAFTLTGTNYQAGAVVNFTNSTYETVTSAISSITSTKITGNATFPVVASSGKWNINVTTPDGGTGTKAGAFTVNKWLQPSTTSVSPVSGSGNTTVPFTL